MLNISYVEGLEPKKICQAHFYHAHCIVFLAFSGGSVTHKTRRPVSFVLLSFPSPRPVTDSYCCILGSDTYISRDQTSFRNFRPAERESHNFVSRNASSSSQGKKDTLSLSYFDSILLSLVALLFVCFLECFVERWRISHTECTMVDRPYSGWSSFWYRRWDGPNFSVLRNNTPFLVSHRSAPITFAYSWLSTQTVLFSVGLHNL